MSDKKEITRFSSNIIMSTLSDIVLEVADPDRSDIGDSIDRGLILVRVLKENGFCLYKQEFINCYPDEGE